MHAAASRAPIEAITEEQFHKLFNVNVLGGSEKRGHFGLWPPVVERSEGQGGGSQSSRPEKGTPQGGVASPLLANLYLHWFDALFHGPQGPARRADVKPVRYADDFVALAKQMGSETIEFIESRLEGKFQLEIREKDKGCGLAGERGKPGLSGVHVS